MDDIKTWPGLSVEESIGMTEINGEFTSMVWPTLGSRTAKEQNRTNSVAKSFANNLRNVREFFDQESGQHLDYTCVLQVEV